MLSQNSSMTTQQESFAQLMDKFQYRYDLSRVFEDFLTMSMCAVTQNLQTGVSYYEDLYLETIAPYKTDELRHQFPKLFGALVFEMEERLGSSSGNDVLGEYYEQNLSKKKGKGQFFTPWHMCKLMAGISVGNDSKDVTKPLRIIDPCCGSGRMLLASATCHGKHRHYYGIDIDHTCVKMATLNLFFNGIFHAEVMCADALDPNDFRISYRISKYPLGIFRIEDKEKSYLWYSAQHAFKVNRGTPKGEGLILPSQNGDTDTGEASQLVLF
jgi:type I restriction-modification system DNA methylase subunit